MITYLKTYVGFLKLGLSRLDADVISYVAYCKDGCYQTNQQIADGVVSTANRIRVVISNLVSKGWLTSEIKNGNARTLRVTDKSLQIIYSESEKNTPIKNDHPMIINDHPSRSDMITPMIKNDHPHDHLRSGGMITNDHPSSYINNNINNNPNKKEIMSSAAGEKSAMPTAATHTGFSDHLINLSCSETQDHQQEPQSQTQNTQQSQETDKPVPDSETVKNLFLKIDPSCDVSVAEIEAVKFVNYYQSHKNKRPDNGYWNGLIENWMARDMDSLFRKNFVEEKKQEQPVSEEMDILNEVSDRLGRETMALINGRISEEEYYKLMAETEKQVIAERQERKEKGKEIYTSDGVVVINHDYSPDVQ